MSKNTSWSDNQILADGYDNWTVKSIGDNALLKGNDIEMKAGQTVSREVKNQKGVQFIKLYKDGDNLETIVKNN